MSVPTLRHYVGDRAGMVRAVLEQSWRDAAVYAAEAAAFEGPLAARVERELATFVRAFTLFGLDRLNAWAMTEGLQGDDAGRAYLEFLLEPTLQAAEAWIAQHQVAGDVPRTVDPRFAALTLYAPVLVLFLHQNHLGGRDLRPADIDAFVRAHAAPFLRYIGAAPATGP